MKKIKAAIIGAGNRGVDAYALYSEKYPHELEITAVAEPRDVRKEKFAKRFKLDKASTFSDWKELLEAPKKADLVFICTQDTMHVKPALLAMEKGYHILLEKPMAVTKEDILLLLESSKKYDVSIAVAHVLRYSPFFSTLKRVLDSGVIGEIQGIQHNENVGHIHYSHSFVRGNWRNKAESSPMILAKSCHDMDILLYLTGKNCRKISSFGSRKVFLQENRPEGAPERCMEGCPHNVECPYYGPKIYLSGEIDWPVSVLTTDLTVSGISKALDEGPYGRCVYSCDNDVVEHQVLNLEFDGGVTAAFTMSAFTNETSRTIKIMGNKGELRGNMEKGEITTYDFVRSETNTISLYASEKGHGGGDEGLVRDFIIHLNDRTKPLASSLDKSVQSHLMAFAAEESMLTGKIIEI